MAIFSGTWLTGDGEPSVADAVALEPLGRSKTAHGARHRRVHNKASLGGAAACRLIVREGWETRTAQEKEAWATHPGILPNNRNRTTYPTPNGWIKFCRANYASAWFLKKADRTDLALEYWVVVLLAITDIDMAHDEFTFSYRADRWGEVAPQPRLFIYQNNPGRKGPPQTFRNTFNLKVFDGPFEDGKTYSHRLKSAWTLVPGRLLTVMTRLATDAGYAPTEWVSVELPYP